jgi:hypothetical protein
VRSTQTKHTNQDERKERGTQGERTRRGRKDKEARGERKKRKKSKRARKEQEVSSHRGNIQTPVHRQTTMTNNQGAQQGHNTQDKHPDTSTKTNILRRGGKRGNKRNERRQK